MGTSDQRRCGSADQGRLGDRFTALVGLGLALTVMAGCSRELTITQDDYINTAMHAGRPKASRTGEPLEVTIVCVSAHDLKNDANERLAPGSGITCDAWYNNRPKPGDKVDSEESHSRFRLPKGHVLLLTNRKDFYGRKIGSWLQGAVTDKKETVAVRFPAPAGLHDDDSVIYIFPRFVDSSGEYLAVPPAVFHPPGAFTHELFVKIGVDESRAHYGQYIDNVTDRKLHGRGKDD